MALCKKKGIAFDTHVLLSLSLLPSLDKRFFRKHCINRVVDAYAPTPALAH